MTVARLTSPAQIVAALPLYLGYTPTESLVVACQHQRGRVGLTLRFDLPRPDDEPELVEEVLTRVRREAPSQVLLAVYTGDTAAASLPRAQLVTTLLRKLEARGVDPIDALLVSRERFWSYLCRDRRCCPAEGRPVDEAGLDDDQLGLLAAELALQGRATLPSREAVEASLAGPGLLEAEHARARCEAAFEVLLACREADDRDGYIERMLAHWTATAVRFSLPRAVLHPDDAAALAVSLGDVLLRDVVATRFDVPGMRPLLTELCRRTPSPWDVPVCTLYAWAGYCEGGGAEVTIALQRALDSEPGYELARMLREALLRQTAPELIRQVTRDVAEDDRIRRWAV